MTKLSMKTIRFHMITGVCIGMIWMIFSHDRIGVMYFGKLVEMADAGELFRYRCIRIPGRFYRRFRNRIRSRRRKG